MKNGNRISLVVAALLIAMTFGTCAATLIPSFTVLSVNTNGTVRGPTNLISANRIITGHRVATISDAIALTNLVHGELVEVGGYWEDNDGGGGRFRWNLGSTTSTNLGTVLKPTALAGRLIRQMDPGMVKVRWFGAKGTLQMYGSTQGYDDTTHLQDALNWAYFNPGTTVELGAGDFMYSDTLTVPPYTKLVGTSATLRGDWIGDYTTTTNDFWWTKNHSLTRLYPKLGFNGFAIYVGVTNKFDGGYPRGNIHAWDGTKYTNYYFGTTLQDFQIEGYVNRLNRGHGIFIDRADAVSIRGVAVGVIAGNAIRVEGTYETRIEDCAFEQFQNRSLPNLFMRMQDSQVAHSTFAAMGIMNISGGECRWDGNFIYNQAQATDGWQVWSNVVSTIGETFTATTNRLESGTPLLFIGGAPSGFDTNTIYWVSLISGSPSGSTFKLNSRLGVNGQGSGARDGYGIASGEVGTWTLSAIPPAMWYNDNCINLHSIGSRIDQSAQSAVALTGPHCQMNTFVGDAFLNLGVDPSNTHDPYAGLNVVDPFYACFFLKNGAWNNTLHPAQVNGAIGDWDPPLGQGRLTGFVILDNCHGNDIGGGFWNCKTNYFISDIGTTGTRIRGVYNQFGDFIDPPRVPISQRLQGGIYFDPSTAPIINVPTTFVIGTNDFTMSALVTWPSSTINAGIMSLSTSATDEGGAYAWTVLARSDSLIEVTRRSSTGTLASGDYSSHYYDTPGSLSGREVWVVVTRTGHTVRMFIDGNELIATSDVNLSGFADSVGGGTNYWHIGRNSTAQSLDGKIVDAGLWNFAMSARQVSDLKVQAIQHKWMSGSPFATVSSGSLVEGKEYRIVTFASGDDFTASGASANSDNEVFTYNGTSPTWTHGSVILRQGIVAWPNFSRGYGSTFPDRSSNGLDATYTGTIHHFIPESQPALLGTSQTFTAANTFNAAGAASTPGLTVSGAPYASGSTTTSKPQLLIQPSGPSSANWNPLGTAFGIDLASGFAGDIAKWQINDIDYLRLSSAGNLTVFNGLTLGASGQITFNGRGAITSPSTGNIQLGGADSDSIASQTLRTQGVMDGTTNTVGRNFTVKVSPGTGTGAGGSFIVQTASAGSAGSTQNTLADALTIDSTKLATFTGSIAVPKTITAGGTTGAQTINKMAGSVNFAASATQLTVTCNLVTASSVVICTIATHDATMTSVHAVPGSGSFVIYPNALPTAETRVNFVIFN